jgi:hypothetical protein
LYCGIFIKPAEFKSFQTDRFGCNNSHNYLIDNKIGQFIILRKVKNLLLAPRHCSFRRPNPSSWPQDAGNSRSARLGPIIVVENRRQKAEVRRPKTEVLSSVFCFPSSVCATASRQGTGWMQAEC